MKYKYPNRINIQCISNIIDSSYVQKIIVFVFIIFLYVFLINFNQFQLEVVRLNVVLKATRLCLPDLPFGFNVTLDCLGVWSRMDSLMVVRLRPVIV